MDAATGQWLFGQAAVVVVLIGFIWLLVYRRQLATAAHVDDLKKAGEDLKTIAAEATKRIEKACDDARAIQEKSHADAFARLERSHADSFARLEQAQIATLAQMEKRIAASDRNSDMWREVARTGVITAREAVGVAANHAGAIPPPSSPGGGA